MEETGWVLLQQAEQYMKEGKRQAAIPLLASHLQKNPDSARGWWLLSLAIADTKQQADCLERVLKLDPQYFPARTRLDKIRGAAVPNPVNSPFVEPASSEPRNSPQLYPAPEVQTPGPAFHESSKPVNPSPEVPKKNTPVSTRRKPKNRFAQFALLGVMGCVALAVMGFGVVMVAQGYDVINSPRLAAPENASVTQIMLPPTWTPTNAPTLAPSQTAAPTNPPLPPTADVLQTSIAKSLVGPSVGYFAPDFNLTNISTDSSVSLSAYSGRPTLIFFWATWCPYCEAEISLLETIYDSYRDDGLEILAVDVDENATLARQYKKSHTMKYILLDDGDSAVSSKYNVTSLPRLFFIEPSGKISYIGIGLMEYGLLDGKVQEIVGVSE